MLTGPYPSPQGVFAAVAGGVVLMGVLELLVGERAPVPSDASRRTFLRASALIALATARRGRRGPAARRAGTGAARPSSRRGPRWPCPARKLAAPAGTDLAIDGQDPWLTPNRDFYRIDTALQAPLIDPAEWSLRIHGMVDRELTLTYQDLLDRGLRDAWITLCCVSNEVGGDLIGNTVWGGVPIKDLLDEVGVQAGADALLSTSEDGWTCGTPLDALTDGRDALLALTMNGEPLPIAARLPRAPGRAGPVRLRVGDQVGRRLGGHPVRRTSRRTGRRAAGVSAGRSRPSRASTCPRDGRTVDAGGTVVAGVAWAQHTGIERVEVRIDDGPWREATLAAGPTVDTWVQWRIDWAAEPGQHTIRVRATDRSGATQTEERADVLPDGATGYHRHRASRSD